MMMDDRSRKSAQSGASQVRQEGIPLHRHGRWCVDITLAQ